MSLAATGHRAEARACYQEALRLRPGFGLAHNNLGALLFQEGELEEATRHLRAALRTSTRRTSTRTTTWV